MFSKFSTRRRILRSAAVRRRRRSAAALALTLALAAALGVVGPAAMGAGVSTTSISGGTGTYAAGGTVYAKSGGALTLTVTTSSDTKCVQLSGAHTAKETSGTAKTSWTFTLTAGSGNGVQTITATAYPNVNTNNGNCSGTSGSSNASYVLDNAGPSLTAAVTPTPNAAGWNRSNVTVTWSATDAGSGVASGPTPASDSLTANSPQGSAVTMTSSATDRLGNTGNGSVDVKLDKNAPTITGSRSPAPTASGWNNTDVTVSFTCSDGHSGIKSCTKPITVTSDTNESYPGTAVDNADNSASATVGPIRIDKAAPTIAGAPATSPNANGWYKENVAIEWSCSDAGSGIASGGCPANSTISSEGTGRTASAAVTDRAGNTATGTSAPAVNLDKTPPTTNALAGDENIWNAVDVDVSLVAADALSNVASTHYKLDDGATQTGTSLRIASEGDHTLSYWSVDRAGNAEAPKTIRVKIDKSNPTITHSLSPAANALGWNRTDVSVQFTCADRLSGIESCGPDRVVSTEGASQDASGVAEDRAGHRVTDPATVSVDKTEPTISPSRDRPPNDAGWYDENVVVTFACGDALSGIDSCPQPETLGEGEDQTASGTARDTAGNSKPASISDIDVDKTRPELSGAATTSPNDSGWYRGDVTVRWTCSDALSGLASACPEASTVTGEGTRAASASVTDRAGNTRATTVGGIDIDRTAPETSASVGAPFANGWHDEAADVTLRAVDALSGVARTLYEVDGGDARVYSGPIGVPGGIHEIRFWSVDEAGNVEDNAAAGHTITVKVDDRAPAIAGAAAPAANRHGWNNGDVTVSFTCDDAETGIAICPSPQPLKNEGVYSVNGLAVDNARNERSTSVGPIRIDKTPPKLAGAPSAPPSGVDQDGVKWYRGDVVVKWTAEDALSEIDPDSRPADATIDGTGRGLGTGPVEVADKAGNTASASVEGINIDRAAPEITGKVSPGANGDGWHNGPVTVSFRCTDDLSGVRGCPAAQVLDRDGADQEASSGDATDHAGNSGGATTVRGIDIDSRAPVSTHAADCTRCGSTMPVDLSAVDQDGLSGVDALHYEVNGGAPQQAEGSSTTVQVPLTRGRGTLRYWAVDRAGNVEEPHLIEVNGDGTAPIVTPHLSPAPNAAGWHRSDVTVSFTADDEDGSGVEPGTVTRERTLTEETDGEVVHGEAADYSGNTGQTSVTVKIDRTDPTITGAVVDGTMGANGWYRSAVTVRFTCSDGRSGIKTCPADQTISAQGAGQEVEGTAVDNAGNQKTIKVGPINVDSVAPQLRSQGPNGEIYTLGSAPAAACSATDDGGSGVDSCTAQTSGGRPTGVGEFGYALTATDKAGNASTATGSYTVRYRFDGVLQPINNTGHQTGTSTSVFKAGSTVPVKLQLKKADGTVVEGAAPKWVTPVGGNATTATVNESSYAATGDSGTAYRWDATGRQWQFNWQTPASGRGFYHRIGAVLDDGQTYYFNIGLK
jgi:hypothetical protein